MSGKVIVAGLFHSTSTRIPHKATRLIAGRPLFYYAMRRVLHYARPDAAYILIPEGPQDDMLAYVAQQLFDGEAVVLRPPAMETAVPYFGWLINHKRLHDEDIIVRAYADEPFSYCEDLRHKLNALLEHTNKDLVMHRPGPQFPDKDWTWAVTGHQWTWRVRLYRERLFRLYERVGWDSWSLTHFRALWQSQIIRPLFVEKPILATEPWRYQPLWVDEPEQLTVVNSIIKDAFLLMDATNLPIPDRLVRELYRPWHAEATSNSTRKTMKPFNEDFDTWYAMIKLAESELDGDIIHAARVEERSAWYEAATAIQTR